MFKRLTVGLASIIFSLPSYSGEDYKEELVNIIKDSTTSHIQDFWGEGITEVYPSKINPRLKINPCENIKIYIPEVIRGSRFQVGIRCYDDGNTWSIINNVRFKHEIPVVVSNSAIKKGNLLTHENVKLDNRDITKLHGRFYTDLNVVLNSRARKNIRHNDTIDNYDIIFLKDVVEGDIINIHSSANNLTVVAKGKALSSGNKGEQINIENLKTGKIIYCVIIDSDNAKAI